MCPSVKSLHRGECGAKICWTGAMLVSVLTVVTIKKYSKPVSW